MPEYERPQDISVKDIAEGAAAFLTILFSEGGFSDTEKRMYKFVCAGSIERFIYRELLKYSGVINFKTSENVSETNQLLYRLVTVYFLHCRYNAKLDRGDPKSYNLEALDDFLYEVMNGAANGCGISFPTKKNEFFEAVSKSSFRLVLPHACYIWNAPKYSEGAKDCVQIMLSVTSFDDENKKSYKEFVLYLLTKERNFIYDFSQNSSVFWLNTVDLPRSGQTYKIEENFSPDKDLILLCLALGFNVKVLKRLIKLRDKAMEDYYKQNGKHKNVRDFKAPYIKAEEEKILRDLLEHSGERLAKVRSLDLDDKQIPRRMLFNANLELLERGLNPIIDLKDKEIYDSKDLLGTDGEKILNQKYEGKIQDKFGKTKRKIRKPQ